MRRIGRPVVIGLVAIPASPTAQAVVVAHMALRAHQCGMRSGQGEPGRRVVKCGAAPVGDRGPVTDRAIRWETRRLVRRADRTIKIREVAVDAGAAAERVVVVHVAGGTLLRRVHTDQRETGRSMVKSRA